MIGRFRQTATNNTVQKHHLNTLYKSTNCQTLPQQLTSAPQVWHKKPAIKK